MLPYMYLIQKNRLMVVATQIQVSVEKISSLKFVHLFEAIIFVLLLLDLGVSSLIN